MPIDENELREMLDRQEISDTIMKYATGIDRRNWPLYRSIFADEVEFDFSSFSGTPAAVMKADDWVSNVSALQDGFDATQHVLTNFVYDISGDDAIVDVYMKAEHFLTNDQGDNSVALGGFYTHRLRRGPDGWKIDKCKLTVTWNRGNRALYQMAAERAGTVHQSAG